MPLAKLLFVEDDPDDIELLTQSLKEQNITDFLILSSGKEAFAFLSSLKDDDLPELIVVDLNMPGMSGYEVIRLLKSTDRYQKIPVFILTTSQRTEIVQGAIRHGAAGYYQKPTSLRDLHTLVRELYQMAC